MKSPMGGMLARAENLSTDSEGKHIPPTPAGFEGVRCRETRPHALSNPGADDTREEQAMRAGRMARVMSTLSEEERYVLELQRKVPVVRAVAVGDQVAMEREGYEIVPLSAHDVGGVETVHMVGPETVSKKTHAEMMEERGWSAAKLSRVVTAAHRRWGEAMRRERDEHEP